MKKLVNDYDLHQQFLAYINDKIEISRKDLEVKVDPAEIYRLQGEIRMLRRLLRIRNEVNARTVEP